MKKRKRITLAMKMQIFKMTTELIENYKKIFANHILIRS